MVKNCAVLWYNAVMIKCIVAPALNAALEKLKKIIAANESDGKKTVIFCEDRLTLAAERTVCAAVGGTFSVSVCTFARFLSSERGRREGVLTSQGSAMAIRRIIEEHRRELKLFNKLSAAAAAGAVYDTIALLYSSKISPSDVAGAAAEGLLESKLGDIALIYSEYEKYLAASGKTDKNAYLGELPEIISRSRRIAESEVIFLGFQSFTRSSLDCVRAAFGNSRGVYGLFIGGDEDIYVNEAQTAFEAAAKEYGGAAVERDGAVLCEAAEALRRGIFNPESFFNKKVTPFSGVHIFEASDGDEELEFIAASIKKHVLDGGRRYGEISVMLPAIEDCERDIDRVFSQYRIPYYADRRHKLSEHPVCAFVLNYLNCVCSGCNFTDSDEVISSPLFPADVKDKDVYRNYSLRLANFRGGVKREPKKEILDGFGFDFDAVQRVRKIFLRGLSLLPAGAPDGVCDGIRKLFSEFSVNEKLTEISAKFKDEYPTAAEFSGRVYAAVCAVIDEAEAIVAGEKIPLKEFIKILRSGFAAAEISLIPPKADAVFVGDIAATANTGSEVVFAARLTSDVPLSSADTALLTDREIAALEKADLGISPKIRQVNMRRREITALNICAFKKHLYLTYPARLGGEERVASEIIPYASALFVTPSGAPVKPLNLKRLKASERALPFYGSEKLPALKLLLSDLRPEALSAVYAVLKEKGYARQADAAVTRPSADTVRDGRALYATFNYISPTALETYFSCPYRNFMQQGLKLKEREEGVLRTMDAGNFIHAVLQKIAYEMNGFTDGGSVRSRAEQLAQELLKTPAYSSLTQSKSGEYTAAELIKEAGEVSVGAYEQIENSAFKVENAEQRCEIVLDGGIKLGGRIDRVDSCGDMVRIIDYKTGYLDASPSKYYTGQKLQLPLYLLAASKGRRGVAAYYFPASVEYKTKPDGVFRLQGFMDGSAEVVRASDTKVEEKGKSEYFNAYLGGREVEGAMPAEQFSDFLEYSALVARQGASEMLGGNITPSPAEDVCSYCKMGGSCGFAEGQDGAGRTAKSIKCARIAEIVKSVKEGGR